VALNLNRVIRERRNGIGRLPDLEGDKPTKKRFKTDPIGFFHIDLAEVQTAEGKLYLFVAIDRTSKFAFVQLVEKADRVTRRAPTRRLRGEANRGSTGRAWKNPCRETLERTTVSYERTKSTLIWGISIQKRRAFFVAYTLRSAGPDQAQPPGRCAPR
jgi:hypothetical protein